MEADTNETQMTFSQETKLLETVPEYEKMDTAENLDQRASNENNESSRVVTEDSTIVSETSSKRKKKSGAMKRKRKRLNMELEKSKADHDKLSSDGPEIPITIENSSVSVTKEPRDTTSGSIMGQEQCKSKSFANGTLDTSITDKVMKAAMSTPNSNTKTLGPNMTGQSTPIVGTDASMQSNSRDNAQKPNEGTESNDTGNYVLMMNRPGNNRPVRNARPRVAQSDRKEPEKKLSGDLRLAIVYTGDLEKVMTEETFAGLQKRLLEELDAFLINRREVQVLPRIVWTGQVKGVLRIDCVDQPTVKWVRDLLLKESFNPEGELGVVLAECLFAKKAREPKPLLRRVTTWVQGNEEIDFVALMRRIQLLNPTLKAMEWKKFGVYEKEGGRIVSFGIPEEHVKDLEAVECTAFSGLRMMTFRIKKRSDPQDE